MAKTSFNQRVGLESTPVEDDFPQSARNGLMYILQQFIDDDFIKTRHLSSSLHAIYLELLRTGKSDFLSIDKNIDIGDCHKLLGEMPWDKVYVFCERVYDNLLIEKSSYDSYNEESHLDMPLEQVKALFESELNNLCSEENLGYRFQEGQFYKPGRPQTQKNIIKANTVLADHRLHRVKVHYNKACRFFNERINPDYQNSVKEALCALESAAEIMSGKKVSKDFSREISKLSGPDTDKLPPPVVQAMIKIFGYRGTGEGVSHGNTDGLQVSRFEAELILSIVGAFVTYLVDFYNNLEPDIPF